MIDPAYLERIGVFVGPDGQYKRHRVRTVSPEYDPTDPKAELKGQLLSYEEELVPHPVILPLATDRASVEEARQKAADAGADFYHPEHGWLRWGRKREAERPENLGAGTVRHTRRRVVVAPAVTDAEPDPDPGPVPDDEQGPEPTLPARGAGGRFRGPPARRSEP